jgi:hypothetical protein
MDRLTARPAANSRNATRMASMHSRIGSSRRTSWSVIMIVMGSDRGFHKHERADILLRLGGRPE